jgi:hypothetical protein
MYHFKTNLVEAGVTTAKKQVCDWFIITKKLNKVNKRFDRFSKAESHKAYLFSLHV